MKKARILFIIIDGLGDRPIKELKNKTPLEAAKTENMDFFASYGFCGLIEPIYKGSFPSSNDAHLSLFGYDLNKEYVGRGVFEAMAAGIKLKKDDVAFRVDFATVDENLIILDRRAGRIKNTKPLVKSINNIEIKGVKFIIKAGQFHRAELVLRGKNLSEKVSDGDPQKINVKPNKILPLSKDKTSRFTADILNKYLEITHQILKNHPYNKKREKMGELPANFLLIRTPGKKRELESFDKKWKTKSCFVATGFLYKGIAKAISMKEIKVKNEKVETKLKAAKKALFEYDFCYLHIKETDEFSHDGKFLEKMKFIEKIDKALKTLKDLKDTLIILTADHCTPCKLKQHSQDPVPVFVYSSNLKKEKIKEKRKFSEKDCKKGELGLIKANEFLKKIYQMISSSKS
ncbi:MAG: 2,3-bisphosphoglycerate-independent phosphoglycerate mutase [Minisyncoccia bacterium]